MKINTNGELLWVLYQLYVEYIQDNVENARIVLTFPATYWFQLNRFTCSIYQHFVEEINKINGNC